ncbi:hypothetical protein L202_03263 [Cryptococcus amylolentus CBS 6039]|uniref:Uncharacterized protein n=1 Tax=Cryptococcus amylolentus CBS 6039 TaxID=1295533 RepID=A0A1E3HXW3_9TREE|nr:hypothetical protein L202_03263 [Cryptococcus amylolentus CBS 6039]ODN81172.1 hypothetical protein L202_03263 [Cryptococcus amylolentus CBS 6039]
MRFGAVGRMAAPPGHLYTHRQFAAPDSFFPRHANPQWITLVVHPGLPGDAGPSSLDWVLLDDNGAGSSSTDLLPDLLPTLPSPIAQR